MDPTQPELPWAHRWNHRTVLGRIVGRIDYRDANGCWLWTGTIHSAGYGAFGFNHHVYYAHRLLFEMYYGPIPKGLVLDHICRVRRCVNPEHLEPVTDRTNIRRGESPSARSTRLGRCSRGHLLAPENIYPRSNGQRMCRPCMDARTAAYEAEAKPKRLQARVEKFLRGETLKGKHPEGFEERLRELGLEPPPRPRG